MENQRANTNRKNNMDENTYRLFCIGLKRAIKEAGYKTNKEFSEGIMHDVNFSKALNLDVNYMMGEKNRIKAAKKVGMDVMEVVALGKTTENDGGDGEHLTTSISVYPMWSLQELNSFSENEMTEEVAKYSVAIQETFTDFGKLLGLRASVIAKDRNRLLSESQIYQSVLESMSDGVKVQDTDRIILYMNTAYRRILGADYTGKECPAFCNNDQCFADEVVKTGVELKAISEFRNRYYGIRCSPIVDRYGRVEKVVTVVRDINEEHEKALRGEVKR